MSKALYGMLLAGLLIVVLPQPACAPQGRVHQNRIDRQRAEEIKKARKAYEADLKRHHKSQSKMTRIMMRESRKKSKQLTPGKK